MSLLYECINTVIAVLISISSGMPNHAASIQLCVQKLRILIEDSDQNCKCVLQIIFLIVSVINNYRITFDLFICLTSLFVTVTKIQTSALFRIICTAII